MCLNPASAGLSGPFWIIRSLSHSYCKQYVGFQWVRFPSRIFVELIRRIQCKWIYSHEGAMRRFVVSKLILGYV